VERNQNQYELYILAESFHRRAPGINFTQINISIFFYLYVYDKNRRADFNFCQSGENPSTFIADMANDFVGGQALELEKTGN